MKKIGTLLVSILAGIALLFTIAACGTLENYAAVSAAYEGVQEAQTIVKKVEVTQGGTSLNSREERYEKAESGYTVTVTVRSLNEIGQGEGMYSEEVSGPAAVGADEVSFGALPAETAFTNASYTTAEDDVTMTATLSASALGLGSGDVSGSISCVIAVTDGNFTSMQISYTSANGNNVSIVFTYTY